MSIETGARDERVFIGREPELTVFGTVLDAACAGRGQLLLLAGDPGIGKTRLAAECASRAQAAGVRVLWGRAWEGDGAPAFWPWTQLVRAYLRDAEPATLIADLGRAGAEIARVMPEVAALLPEESRASPGTSLGLQPEQERFRFFDGLTLFLKAASRRQPLLLVLDDLQWADTSSLLLWQFLIQELADSRLLVIGTYRDGELASDHPLFQTLGAVRREPVCHVLVLHGLHAEELARYVATLSHQTPSADLVATLAARTEGNPFFVRELVRLMLAEGTLNDPQRWRPAIPAGIRQVIGRRLSRLSAECRDLLRLGAAIGRGLDLELLSAVAAAERGEADVDVPRGMGDTLATLEPAIATGLLRVEGTTCYAFSHAMIREALYAEVAAATRPRLHRRIGEALERAKNRSVPLSELAYHFAEAGPDVHAQERAYMYLRQAGDQALAALAYEEAATLYQHALKLCEILPSTDDRTRCTLLLSLEEAQMRAGNVDRARAASLQAAGVARTLNDPELFARAALGFGWSFRVNVVDEERIVLLEQALTFLPESDHVVRARVLARLAIALHWKTGSLERRDHLSAAAVAMARRLGDPATLAFALNARLLAMWVAARADERAREARELFDLAHHVREPELMLQSSHWLITSLLEHGDIAAADREIRAYGQLAAELRQPLYLWFVAIWRTMRALLDGQLDRVEDLAAEALALGERVERDNATQTYSGLMFSLRQDQGRLAELLPMVEAMVETPDALDGWRCALALIYSESGQIDAATRQLALLSQTNFVSLEANDGQLTSAFMMAEICATVGDAKSGRDLYDALRPFAHQNAVMGMGIAVRGSTARILGRLATLLGRYADAETHFADALAMHERMRAHPLIARTQHEWAAMLLRRGTPDDRQRAQPLLDAALATACQLGMTGLEAKLIELRETVNREPETINMEPSSAPQPGTPDPGLGTSLFRRAGDSWTITFAGTTVTLRHTRGLDYLACLLSQPGRKRHATEVLGITASGASRRRPPGDTPLITADLGDAGEVLDAAATAQYQRRLAELRDDLAEAEANDDLGRTEALREELALLTEQLASAGRGRRASSHAERARVAVAKALARTLKNIAAAHPVLGRHLKATIRTGYFCSYTPDPRIDWEI